MDKKLKAKWVKALRSGRYPQGDGELYIAEHGTFCCLGVLHICAGYTSEEIDGFTFKDSAELLGSEDYANELAGLNDAGAPFELIAGLIAADL